MLWTTYRASGMLGKPIRIISFQKPYGKAKEKQHQAQTGTERTVDAYQHRTVKENAKIACGIKNAFYLHILRSTFSAICTYV